MARRLALLLGVLLVLGRAVPHGTAPATEESGSARTVARRATAVVSAPAEAGLVAERPQPAAAAALPPYEIIGSATSPDGKSWCIVSVMLWEQVPREDLRALWALLRKEQVTEWGRFTCRVYLPETDPFGDSWADVNDLTIIESPRPAPRSAPATRVEEEQATLAFEGDRCFLLIGDMEFNMPRDRITWIWGPDGPIAEITYPVPVDDARETWESRTIRIPVARADAPPPPPACGGAWMR
jgi:hypothetical protein